MGLQTVVSHHVGGGSQTWVPWNNRIAASALSHTAISPAPLSKCLYQAKASDSPSDFTHGDSSCVFSWASVLCYLLEV